MGKKAYLSLSAALVALLLSGCGGGGSNGGSNPPPTKAAPSVTINWPQRSRDFAAPTSALSVKAVFSQTGSNETAIVLGNRPTPLGGGSATYTSTDKLTTGNYHVSLTFYANADEVGSVVGTAGADVKVNTDGHLTKPDGTPLGDVQFSGKVASVTFNGTNLYKGDMYQLLASAFDADNNPVVVTPGSFTYSVVSGGDKINLAADGMVTAVSEGDASVQVSIDGLSKTATFHILVRVSVQTVTLETNDLALAPGSSTLWASVPMGATQHANQIVPINTADGSIGTPISADNPGRLAISDDGTFLFVSSGNTVRRVSTANGSTTDLFTVPSSSKIYDLVAVPGGNTSVAVVTEAADQSNSDTGTYIVDTTGARPNHPGVGQSVVFKPGIASLYGMKFNFTEASVTDSGLAITFQGDMGFSSKGYYVALAGNNLYCSTGDVVDVSTRTHLGRLQTPPSSSPFNKHSGIAARADSNRVFLVDGNPSPKGVITYDATTLQQIGTESFFSQTPGDVRDTIAFGPHDIAFRTSGSSKDAVVFIRDLP